MTISVISNHHQEIPAVYSYMIPMIEKVVRFASGGQRQQSHEMGLVLYHVRRRF